MMEDTKLRKSQPQTILSYLISWSNRNSLLRTLLKPTKSEKANGGPSSSKPKTPATKAKAKAKSKAKSHGKSKPDPNTDDEPTNQRRRKARRTWGDKPLSMFDLSWENTI